MAEGTARATRGRRRWSAAPVVALAVLAVLAGCSSAAPAVPSVIVVGDAPMAVARPQVAAILHPVYSPTFLVRPAGTIARLSSLLGTTMASSGTPRVVVTDVGTTDALHPAVVTAAAPLAPLVTATAGVPCVVLTTVDLQTDERSGGTVAARVNHEIVQLAAADPERYKVVDWNEFLATLPPPSVPTYLEAGSVLETAAGAHWLATADLAAVRACGTRHQPTVVGPNPA